MKVVISCEDGGYFIRKFREGFDVSAYEPPPSVPDHVVAAYAALGAQLETMNTLLMMFDDEKKS